MENELNFEEINSILDDLADWLSHENIVAMDLEQKQLEDGTYEVAIIVEHIGENAIQENLDTDENIRRILDIPETVSLSLPFKNVKENDEKPLWEVSVKTILTDPILEEPIDLDIENYEIEELDSKIRPCPGGYWISTAGVPGRGSICTSINYRGSYRLLSNNHVISKNGNVGKWTHQPTATSTTNRLAKVTGYDHIHYYQNSSESNPTYNEKDIAWCDTDGTKSSQSVRGIGNVTGMPQPRLNETIQIFGANTQLLKEAKIHSLTKRYKSKGTLGYSWWKNGVALDARVTQRGDSGSAYVAKDDKKLVAIHRSGNSAGSTGCLL